ncbi:MAG: glycoside hydrolase [Fibrobacteraceae bacterium]|nr:glycoside hydrolase [Fibrobacteraceae bacterium]
MNHFGFIHRVSSFETEDSLCFTPIELRHVFALVVLLVLGFAVEALSGVSVSVDASAGVRPISPYLYGKNIEGIKDTNSNVDDEETSVISKMNEAGIRFIRAGSGNNSTRYNWRKHLMVHPDWYNNVYNHNWDYTAKKIQDHMPKADAMYSLQLAGWVAKTTEYNFADWDYYVNHNNTWAKANLDLAGGGEVNDAGELVKAGDYTLYNEPWPADSTVAIIDHWTNTLKYDMKRFTYWSMDNEMDIWAGTHSDLKLPVTGPFLVERYVDVALKAREAWPGIKLTGPVVANEWFWCAVSHGDGSTGRITATESGEDRDYCWLEYFIKKVAETEKSSGKRLLDVFDMHWYPTEKTFEEQMNWHRVFFDTSYVYPGANGIKMVNGKWENDINKEFIFARVNGWLEQYFGKDHGITLGFTETDLGTSGDVMTTALVYASFLGTFMDNGVEIFTPWTWSKGMYEVVHLFSRYGHENRVSSFSSNDSLLSAYTSVGGAEDSMTVFIVNRSATEEQDVAVDVSNFKLKDGSAATLTLAGLKDETFESHDVNGLKVGEAAVALNKVSLRVPAKSITAVLLVNENGAGMAKPVVGNGAKIYGSHRNWYVDNSRGDVVSVALMNSLGQQVGLWKKPVGKILRLDTEMLPCGQYLVRVVTRENVLNGKIALQ